MQDLIRIKTTPAQIAGNFDEVEAQLTEYLRQYDVVVTQDSVANAKKLATELNKQIGELDRRIKEALAEASAPIKEADEKRKHLVQLGKDARAKIQEQVKRYEDETRKLAAQLLDDYRESLWRDHGVSVKYQHAEYEDLVKLTAVTKSGNLAAAVKKDLETRVRDDKAMQDRTGRRLAELSGASYEAGLAAPLTRDHVEHFLFAADEKYAAELQRILDAEVERQNKAEQRAREQAQREAQQKAEAERREKARQERMEQAGPPDSVDAQGAEYRTMDTPAGNTAHVVTQPSSDDTPAPQSRGDDTVTWSVVMTFEVRVPATVTADEIKREARSIVKPEALKTLKNIGAQKARQAAA